MSNAGNAIDLTGSAGIVAFDGISAMSSLVVSNHATMIGTGAGSITGVAPSATSGYLLTSNGTGTDPSFQPYSGNFIPNSQVQLFDDFAGTVVSSVTPSSTGIEGLLNWWSNSNTTWNITSVNDSSHPGILVSNSALTSSDSLPLFLNNNGSIAPQYFLGGGVLIINWVFNIHTASTITNSYTLRLGMGDTSNADQVNGVYFEYSDGINSGNWNVKTASSSSITTVSSSTAASTGWHNAQIVVNANASSVSYSIDGTSLGTITSHIPTAAITPFVDFMWNAGTVGGNSFLYVDLFYLSQTLTTAR